MRVGDGGLVARHRDTARRGLAGEGEVGIRDHQRREQVDGAGNVKHHRAVWRADRRAQGTHAGIRVSRDVINRAVSLARVAGAHRPAPRAHRVWKRREIAIRQDHRQHREIDVAGLQIRHAEIIIPRQIRLHIVGVNVDQFRIVARILTGLEERRRQRRHIGLQRQIPVAAHVIKFEPQPMDGVCHPVGHEVRGVEVEEIRQRHARTGRAAVGHRVGEVNDGIAVRIAAVGGVQLLGQHAVINQAAVALEHAQIPASRRQPHGRGIRQQENIFPGRAGIKTAVFGVGEIRQRRALGQHQIGVATQFQQLEGGLIGVGGDIERKIPDRIVVVGVEGAAKRQPVRQDRNVIVHLQRDRRGMGAWIVNAQVIGLVGQQRQKRGRNPVGHQAG